VSKSASKFMRIVYIAVLYTRR